MLSSPLLQDSDFKEEYPAEYEEFLSDPVHTHSAHLNHEETPDDAIPNVLENLDNLLRIYRDLSDDEQRAKVYLEFWQIYSSSIAGTPLLLYIPPRVRGYLSSMAEVDMEPYKRDRIMGHVLSRNGILEEPRGGISTRFLFSYFVQFEVFNYCAHFTANYDCVASWTAFSLWLLMMAEIFHIGIHFGRGDPWRAMLMECMVPLTFIAMIQWIDTPFTANVLRTLLEDQCAVLCTINGRIALNMFIVTLCVGSLNIADWSLWITVSFVVLWSVVVFVLFRRLKYNSNYARIATADERTLYTKFKTADEDKDGVLNAVELRQWFKSYNQIVSMWQIELMISQYDIQRDGGLRFDALKRWFDKVPINHLTRRAVLSSTIVAYNFAVSSPARSHGNPY